MTLIGDLIPQMNSSNSSKTMLDLTYRHSVILLSDVVSMGLGAAGISLGSTASAIVDTVATVPLLGFVYENPSQLELLKYQYSEYPYLNKALIVNSYVRNNTRFTLVAHRCITPSNSIPINIAMNEALFQLIKTYADMGGTFTLVTMWGVFNNCVLEELNGLPPEHENGVGGTSFEFKFLRLGFNKNSLLKTIASGVKTLASGVFK